MKKAKNIFLKIIKCLPVLFLVLTSLNCTVDLPETDNTPPKFSFQITGDGFNQTFDQDTNFNSMQLNLRQGSTYDFILTGSDAGGVKQIQWQYAHDYIEFTNPISSPWIKSTNSSLSSVINWYGDRTDPLSGNILAGKIVAEGDLVSHEFFFTVTDFGREDGNTNTITISLNILNGKHNTEVISF